MAYTDIDRSSDYFNTVLYTGNATNPKAITGVGFQPDWVWIKDRDNTFNHQVHDVVRGADQGLLPNTTNAEADYNSFVSFDSDGFSVTGANGTNTNSADLVAWNWLGANGTSSNTDGSITSTVSANTTSGFSIVSYTGSGSAATIGHGLSTSPSMILVKNRSTAYSWIVYHKSLGATKNLYLDLTNAADTSSIQFNDTEPTSSVFSVGTSLATNKSGDNLIAYCFAEKKGFSKAFSYTGNGNADGSFVFCEFRPAFILVKNTSTAGTNWQIVDNKRLGYNGANNRLYTDDAAAESTTQTMDILSNGFKMRTTNNLVNASGSNYIGIAFAENPFVTSTGIPTTAR